MKKYSRDERVGQSALRKGRWSEEGRYYVLTTVTHRRTPLFKDADIARFVINEMKYLHDDGDVFSLAWVLMPDHLHWLISLSKNVDLSRIMMRMKGRSARRINAYLKKQGKVWQKAFYDRALRKEDDVRNIARYIVANPLRAGLVQDIGQYPLWDAIWL
jgi:putative transposase